MSQPERKPPQFEQDNRPKRGYTLEERGAITPEMWQRLKDNISGKKDDKGANDRG